MCRGKGGGALSLLSFECIRVTFRGCCSGVNCVCLHSVANYDDVVVGPTVDYALDAWNSSCHHVRVRAPAAGGFDAGFARQVTVDAAVYTPRDKSIVFWLDTDILVLPGLIRNILRFVWEGHTSFAPVVVSMPELIHYRHYEDRQESLLAKKCRKLRSGGYGMVGVYVSDLDRVGGVPSTLLARGVVAPVSLRCDGAVWDVGLGVLGCWGVGFGVLACGLWLVCRLRAPGSGLWAVFSAPYPARAGETHASRCSPVPVKARNTWGAEDRMMAFKIRKRTKQVRVAVPYLWHMDHPHAKMWATTADGIALDEAADKHDPFKPRVYEQMPPDYWERSLLWTTYCGGIISTAFNTNDYLNSDIPFIKESPAFQRWSVNQSSLYDFSSLPKYVPSFAG